MRNRVVAQVPLFAALLLLLLLAACSKPVTPPAPTLPGGLSAGWNRIAPAGETICADGSEYAFYVNPGTVNKLVVDFEGGGACWNGGLCSSPSTPGNGFQGLYTNRVYGSPADYGFRGIYDREDPDNPFRDWYQVHVSYCTGDLHLGDNVASYPAAEGEVTVRHKGALNTRAVLGWVFSNFSAPETVFVAGVSAGAYASIIWLPEVAERYPDAALYGLGDSGAGVVTPGFFAEDAANWRVDGALPDLGTPIALDENILANLYRGVGQTYPDAVLAQYNSLFDGTQIGFYGLMQGITQPTPALAQEWSGKMTASLAAIAAGTPNFRSYVSTLDVDNDPANGTAHVILQRPQFYTLETSGVRFAEWVGNLANGRGIENVSPSDRPASALGDSPTIAGTIANLGRGDLAGKRLELAFGQFAAGPTDDTFASSPVADDGSFSLRFPGEAEMTGRLFDAGPQAFSLPGCETTVTPETFRLAGNLDFDLLVDGEPTAEVNRVRLDDPSLVETFYLYVDRDVRVSGTCAGGDYAGLVTDIDLRKGWNTLVFDYTALEFRNDPLGEGYGWLIPTLCGDDCPTPEPPPEPEVPRAP